MEILTALQWAKKGFIPNEGAKGTKQWTKLLFRREAKPFSPLMRQSAHVRSKSFWAMVC